MRYIHSNLLSKFYNEPLDDLPRRHICSISSIIGGWINNSTIYFSIFMHFLCCPDHNLCMSTTT